jgi:PIN domain nuclease of toxin-antitoxin system
MAIWAALDPDALTQAERGPMARVGRPLVLSAVAVWELTLKWHSFQVSGTTMSPVDPQSAIAFAAAMGLELLPLTGRHAATKLAQPGEHKNPFEELLLVRAQEERMRLLPRDAKLVGHGLAAPRYERAAAW